MRCSVLGREIYICDVLWYFVRQNLAGTRAKISLQICVCLFCYSRFWKLIDVDLLKKLSTNYAMSNRPAITGTFAYILFSYFINLKMINDVNFLLIFSRKWGPRISLCTSIFCFFLLFLEHKQRPKAQEKRDNNQLGSLKTSHKSIAISLGLDKKKPN